MPINVPFYVAMVSGLLSLAMLAGSASADIKDPLQQCAAPLNCTDKMTNMVKVADPPINEQSGALPDVSSEGEYKALPLALAHPEFFGYIGQNSDQLPPLAGAVVAANGDPVPEPTSLAVLGAGILWFGAVRTRRANSEKNFLRDPG